MVEIEIADLSLRFRNAERTVDALAGADLRAAAGTFTAVVGGSGCGKTTLLRAIAGLQKPDSGSLRFGPPSPSAYTGGSESGRDGTENGSCGRPTERGGRPTEHGGRPTERGGRPTERGGRPRIGFMFQDPRLLPWLTVRDNLALAFPEKEVDEEEIRTNLALVGLEKWADERPDRLSGGMAQRAALARALCRRPEILLLDEPFGALDAITRKRLQAECAELWSGRLLTVILVTHDIEEAVFLADRVAVMEAGRFRANFTVDLSRPRDRHGSGFQELCRRVEGELQDA